MTMGFIIMDYWWVIIPGIVLAMFAQAKLSSTYNRYTRVANGLGLTGAQAAREILDGAGLHDMPVNEVGGRLTDHYDPIKRALFLSSDNFRGRSIAALGVAAHEAGHALQHQAAYAPLKIRMAVVPVTQFASSASGIILMLGFIFRIPILLTAGIVLFSVIAFFQLVTLPVEYDASRRAKQRLLQLGLIHPDESGAVSKVLNAAALTYVAALVTALLQLLQIILIARGRGR